MSTTEQDGNSCFCLKSLLNISYQVHPINPSGPRYSEFLVIDSKKTLRIIHVKPDSQIARINFDSPEKRLSMSRHSLTEEYWFTRWSKPLKTGSCNCSFRRSQRYSKLSNQFNTISFSQLKNHSNSNLDISNIDNVKLAATKITNIDTFVERLVQDTYFEALQEYIVKTEIELKNKNQMCYDNVAYNIDNLDNIVLRNKIEPDEGATDLNNVGKTIANQSLTVQSNNNKDIIVGQLKTMCSHKNNGKSKPLVMLLHGIGSTADVWWNIIYNLHGRGYEIIAPDMLGHGFSSAPNIIGAYKFKNLLRNSLQIFDYYVASEERKAIIIGHSFGCSLGTAIARYRMQKIVQLILISGGGPTPLAAPVNEQKMSCNCATILKPFVFCGLKRSFFYSSRGKYFKPCEIDNGIPSYVLKYIEKGQYWPEGDAAFHRRILIPTLLVHGLQDTNVTLVQECEMERTIPRAFLELIPNAGHMSMIDTPERLSHMITCFTDWWVR
ncbi:hydrolase [Oryctes borbonicus]|uniref:acylglycerol lipase n=1 Tax=Oryctes borbonicus TaxID=1629725 RepID=A0A0T6B7Z5_9SCAR|nr:hydrolase [Oryctes borbonicus]